MTFRNGGADQIEAEIVTSICGVVLNRRMVDDGLVDWGAEHLAPFRDPVIDIAARRGHFLVCSASMRISQMFACGSRKLVILKNIFLNILATHPTLVRA